jgi:integrase/recombinase XerD
MIWQLKALPAGPQPIPLLAGCVARPWWVRSIGKRAGLGQVHPHMLRAAFIMAALEAGVPLRDVQIAARHADPRTTTVYDRRRQNFDRHAAYVVVAFVTGG